MENLVIYGFGGFARETACLVNIINKEQTRWNLLGFIDDIKPIGEKNKYGQIIGNSETLNNYKTPINVVIAVGSPKLTIKIRGLLNNPLINYVNLIAPDVIFLDKNEFKIGVGNIICSNSFVSCNVSLGDFNIINNNVSIGHDTEIGSFNSIMPAVKISGSITIGDCNLFGANAFLMQTITIGNEVVVGANSALLNKSKDGFTYIGNPAKKFKF